MYQTVLEIEGMACGMCEAHINDTVRRTVAAKKVTSSHKKGQTCIVSDDPVDGAALVAAIAATGYTVRSITVAPYEKKRFSFFGK